MELFASVKVQKVICRSEPEGGQNSLIVNFLMGVCGVPYFEKVQSLVIRLVEKLVDASLHQSILDLCMLP